MDGWEQFTVNFWKSFYKGLGTQVNVITTLPPRTNGQAERIILTFEGMLKACMLDFN